MKRNFVILSGIMFLLEIYVYQAFKSILEHPWQKILYWIITIIPYILVVWLAFSIEKTDKSPLKIQVVAVIVLAIVLPKLFIIISLLIDDIARLFGWIISYFSSGTTSYPGRRKFIGYIGIGLAATFSALIWDGVLFGRFRFKVRKVKVKLNNLPAAFKGYKIVQISDVHSGSFSKPEKLQHAIDLINEQNADLVLFTGDMVNNVAEEFQPFIPLFSQIKAKDGKLATLGNHDYGMYHYTNAEDGRNNVNRLIQYEKQAGFDMLRNEYRIIEKNGEKLYIVGVENWGLPPFPQFGDLDKATIGLPKDAAKILMSHDPTHFDEIVKKHHSNIQLTLSGHTHGMQFGLDLKNTKWSPAQYRYPKWMDLYESLGKYLYVNRGFGVIGFPGRVGIDPEITLFILE